MYISTVTDDFISCDLSSFIFAFVDYLLFELWSGLYAFVNGLRFAGRMPVACFKTSI